MVMWMMCWSRTENHGSALDGSRARQGRLGRSVDGGWQDRRYSERSRGANLHAETEAWELVQGE